MALDKVDSSQNSNNSSFDFAEWVGRSSESEIRRLLRYSPRYYFAGGQPGIIPVRIFHTIIQDILEQEKNYLKDNNSKMLENYIYGMTEGNPQLREVLSKRLQKRDGIPNIDPSMVTISTGSQQMLYSLCDTLLNPGDIILTARPTYLGFIQPAEKLGGIIVTIPSDDYGIIPEFIPEAFQSCKRKFRKVPKLLYCVPYSDNPKGTSLTPTRKNAIVDYAYDLDFFIVEDAAYKEIQFDSNIYSPIKQLDPNNERIAYLSTSTKEAAAFRIGYSVLPSELREQIIKAKGFYDLCSSEWVQKILTIYYEKYIDSALPEVRQAYKERRDAMVEAIEEFLLGQNTNPTGGFFVWYEASDKSFNSTEFIHIAIKNNVSYVPGAAFYPKNGYAFKSDRSLKSSVPKYNSMRLGYSLLEPDAIKEGIEHFGNLLDKLFYKNRKQKISQRTKIFSSLYY